MAQLSEAELQIKLRTYAAARYGYRRGGDGEIEKDVFDGTLPEGWADTPAHVDGVPDESPEAGTADDGAAPEAEPVGLTAPYDQYGWPQLAAELKRRVGKGPRIGTPTDDIAARLAELDAAQD